METLKKIALIGPESTGKTTLCIQLAEHYKTSYVPEFSRGYMGSLNRKYTLEDIEYCTREQIKEEQTKSAMAKKFLFCDTELINAKVWCEDLFGTTPEWIEERINKHHYDLFLLTYPDLPFEEDPVRENGHRREFFYDWYKKELEERKYPYEIIKGVGAARLVHAIAAIEKNFRK